MNYFWSKFSKIINLVGDASLLYLSLFLTLFIRYQSNYSQEIWHWHWPIFTGLFIIWLIIFYSFNLYDLSGSKSTVDFLSNYLKAVILNVVLGVLYFYLLSPNTNIRPRIILIILITIFSLLFLMWRKIIQKIFSSKKLYQNLLLIGYEPLIKELLPKAGTNHRFGFNFCGIVTENALVDPEIKLKQYRLNDLNELIKNEKINLLVINEPGNEKITELLFKVLPLRVNFISLTNFYEQNTFKIPLRIINQGWFLDNFSEGKKGYFEIIKRIFDILIGLVALAPSLILTPFIVLVIALDSKGKILFKQVRVCKDGKTFTALKFRTMYSDSEKKGAMWAAENDPRITKVGRLLRKIRLDEIPQLWNIIRGEMRFVGPRPERPEFIDQLKETIPFYKERLLVRPGLTGWAQINFPYASSVEDSLKKLQYDLYYIKHRSFFLDLSIILKTLNIILKRDGR